MVLSPFRYEPQEKDTWPRPGKCCTSLIPALHFKKRKNGHSQRMSPVPIASVVLEAEMEVPHQPRQNSITMFCVACGDAYL